MIHGVSMCAWIIFATYSSSKTFFVAPGEKNASDDNPGSEEKPFRTLTKAAEVAQPNDKVWVKAGIYYETLAPESEDVTFAAYGDDKVIIRPPDGERIEPTRFTLVLGCEAVYECHADTAKKLLRVDGHAVMFVPTHGTETVVNLGTGESKQIPVSRTLKDHEARRWTTQPDGTLQLNLGGKNPAEHVVELCADNFVGIRLAENGQVVRGFEIHDASVGVQIAGQRNLVEDCVVRRATSTGAVVKGNQNILRRCSILRCWKGIDSGDCPGSAVIEENLVLGSGQPNLAYKPPQADISNPWGPRTGLRMANTYHTVVRHNIFADGGWAAWWADVNVYGVYYYGNVMWRNPDRGIYNEYPANDTRLLYNSVVSNQDGIVYRFCWRTMAMYNYLADNKNRAFALWGPHRDVAYRFDNLIAKNLVKESRIYLSISDHQGMKEGLPQGWPGKGEISASSRFRSLSNLLLDNIYAGRPKEAFADFNGVMFDTLGAFQQATGAERGSKIDANASIEALGLRLFTVRIPETCRADMPVPVVANPMWSGGVHADPLPYAGEDDPFFWTLDHGTQPPGKRWWNGVYGYSYEWPHFNKPVRRLLRMREGFDPHQPLEPNDTPAVWLEAVGHIPESIPEAGSGWWSPSLPVTPGAQIEVSFRVSGEEVEHVKPMGGPVAFVWLHSLTGQHGKKELILGRLPDGTPVCDGVLEGDFPWRQVKATIVAPEEAKRFHLFLGLAPAKGTVRFADISVNTIPGEPPLKSKVKPTAFEPLDLSPYVNRELDSDVGAAAGAPPAEDFVRNYAGLPTIDLSKVRMGRYNAVLPHEWEGDEPALEEGERTIPFEVGGAISLRNFRRPPATLPLAVNDITIKRNVTALYFLHAGPMQMGNQEYWRYIIHYQDQTTAEVIPLPEIALRHYREPYFTTGPVQAAAREGAVEGVGYVLAWHNPRPDMEVEHIDFRSMDVGQAVLLGITAGTS